MALSSLLLKTQNADITATDYQPEVFFSYIAIHVSMTTKLSILNVLIGQIKRTFPNK